MIIPTDNDSIRDAYNFALRQGVVLRPSDEYDANGLRFPLHYLNMLGMDLLSLPFEVWSEYVDLYTKTMIDNNDSDFLITIREQLIRELEAKEISGINATAIGNIAYIYHNCESSDIRLLALRFLEVVFLFHSLVRSNGVKEWKTFNLLALFMKKIIKIKSWFKFLKK